MTKVTDHLRVVGNHLCEGRRMEQGLIDILQNLSMVLLALMIVATRGDHNDKLGA